MHTLTPQQVKRQKIYISIGYWISTFVEGASIIIIPLYFYSIGINASKIAVTFLFYESFGLVTNTISGLLINKWGYRKAFVISLLFHSIASLGYLALLDGGPMIFTALLVNGLRSFRGIAKELIKITSASFYKHFSKSHIDNQFLLGGKESIKGIGILTGTTIFTLLSFKDTFLLLGVLTVISMIVCWFFLYDYREQTKVNFDGFFNVNKDLKILALIRAFLYAGRDIWAVIALPLFLSELGYSNISIGIIIALGLIIFGITQFLGGFFVKSKITFLSVEIKKKWKYQDTLTPVSIVLSLIPLLIFHTSQSWLYILCVFALYNLFAGFATAPHNYLHIRLAQKHRASVDIAYYQTVSQLGKVFAVLLSGILYDLIGIQGCLLASSILLLLSALFSCSLNIKSRAFHNQHQIKAIQRIQQVLH